MRVVIANIDKNPIIKYEENIKYVLISDDICTIKKEYELQVKPIIILYNGSYVVDLENKRIIINKSIDNNNFYDILKYINRHNITFNLYKKGRDIYGIKIFTSNYHRRLIIPYMFNDLYPKVSCITIGKNIYVYSKEASIINAIDEVLNYLNVNNNYVDLENIYTYITNKGYYKENINLKGIEMYEN